MSTPALLEALEDARKRVETLEIEKSKALQRFDEQAARIRALQAEVAELKTKIRKGI